MAMFMDVAIVVLDGIGVTVCGGDLENPAQRVGIGLGFCIEGSI